MKTTRNQSSFWRFAALLVLACIPVALVGCNKARHYRTHQDAESLFAVLHEQIKPGNTLEHVENLLGKGTPPKDQAKLVRVLQKMAQVRPQGYPEGIQENDQFAGFSFNGSHSSTVYLQFRNGKIDQLRPQGVLEGAGSKTSQPVR